MAFGLFTSMTMLMGLAIYLVPTIVAAARRPTNMAAAILVNVLLGWTMLGWVVALVLALGPKRQLDPYPYYPGGYRPGYVPPSQPGVYQQGYAPPSQPYPLPPAQVQSQPPWGTPGPVPYGYQDAVSDAPVEISDPYRNPPPPA